MNNPFKNIDERLSNIENLLLDIKHIPKENKLTIPKDEWLDLNELVAYDPEKRSRNTFYRYTSKGLIPHHKPNKKLIFLKSEIDEWLKSGKIKSNSEIENEVDKYLSKNK
ncbi:helix-turn-helix domain-containing protein [Tenacibaculum maritimum]|uniref:helix-turn-helix domain-containing protein n=1 Tax=Tenacibaculum TaxID=104267 RepID=UPI0012E600AB|nr:MULTISPECIES: helix-turn-helix domain-containing protein [Tenacibaculum]CAA0227744.1 conserved hypothetical protein [Tenacibaculum maritimum]